MMPTRHSPFYSPFLAAQAAGFLEKEGITAELRLPNKGESAGALLRAGEIEVSQSAVSATWAELDKGSGDVPLHFAQINLRDGFLLVGREREAQFDWRSLEGKTLVADHGKQPMVMLRWAARHHGIDWSKVRLIDAGAPEDMESAFRAGQGDYVHLQGGVPQQMEQDGAGMIVARVGEGLKPLAFSSISAYRPFIESDALLPFTRGFAKAKSWTQQSPANDVAKVLKPLFPMLTDQALAFAIEACQQLGCWEGGATIPQEMYEEAQSAFASAGALGARHAYEKVCVRVAGV